LQRIALGTQPARRLLSSGHKELLMTQISRSVLLVTAMSAACTTLTEDDSQTLSSQHAVGTRIEIPGVTPDFSVVQTSARTFVLQSYANAVLVDLGGELALIDTLMPAFLGPTDLPNLQATIGFLASTGKVSSTKVRYIVNTHWHPDHIGNNDALREADTEIVAARGGTLRVSTPQSIKFFGAEVPAWPAATWPSREVATALTLGGSLDVRYAPYSHTTTDLVVRLPKEKLVVVGDLIINGSLAFADHDNGGTMRGLLLSLDQVLATTPADHLVVPGHAAVMTRDEARAWASAIRDGIRFVDAKLAAGASLADIQAAADEAPESVKTLSNGTIPLAPFLEFTHRDLSERDLKALVASRVLARLKTIDKLAMVVAIGAATLGGEDAAGTEYDTLAFEVDELDAIGNILTPAARTAMAVYERFVVAAREAGRTDLTAAEYEAMLLELARL
jgi:glyoxylase-like metal-dependent hydrolase (beta-lactamase superfamily II)